MGTRLGVGYIHIKVFPKSGASKIVPGQSEPLGAWLLTALKPRVGGQRLTSEIQPVFQLQEALSWSVR